MEQRQHASGDGCSIVGTNSRSRIICTRGAWMWLRNVQLGSVMRSCEHGSALSGALSPDSYGQLQVVIARQTDSKYGLRDFHCMYDISANTAHIQRRSGKLRRIARIHSGAHSTLQPHALHIRSMPCVGRHNRLGQVLPREQPISGSPSAQTLSVSPCLAACRAVSA